VEQVTAGFASMDQAIEAQNRNPDEVRYGQTLDRMRASEWYIKMQEQHVTAEIGRGDLLAKAWAASQLAETGVMPGMPEGGQVPNKNPNAVAANGQAPGGMNTPGLPDMQAGAIAPNQEGANGVPQQPGLVPGQPRVPTNGAAAGMVQQIR
jgi:hypothetical protein